MKGDALKSQGKAGLMLLLPLVFIVVPTSWFEGRRSICLIRNVFGVKCPGCGMTRAISCVFHGNFKKAFEYNKLVVVVFPLLCYVWVRSLSETSRPVLHRRGLNGVQGQSPLPGSGVSPEHLFLATALLQTLSGRFAQAQDNAAEVKHSRSKF